MELQKARVKIPKKKITIAVIAVLLALSFLCTALVPRFWDRTFAIFGLGDFAAQADESPFSIHILNVGKADAILVCCEGESMLIDAGLPESGDTVCRYLKKRGVQSLAYAVGTHPDQDHIGGMAQVLRTMPVDTLLTPAVSQGLLSGQETYDAMLAALGETHQVFPHPGEIYFLGSAEVTVIGPRTEYEENNNTSLVLMITYGETRFLMMGDAETAAEMDLLEAGLDLQCDVLKVGHHGSKTSTCGAFLSATAPAYAAISVGPDSNGLPDASVLRALRESGAQIYRTDLDGTLIFMSDGKNVTIQTEGGT